MYPVLRPTAQNRHIQEKYVKSSGGQLLNKQVLQKTKAVKPGAVSAADVLRFRKRRDNPAYLDTGLDRLMVNPFYMGKDKPEVDKVESIIIKYGLSKEWSEYLPKVMTQERITLQTLAEIRFGLDPEQLTSKVPNTKNGEPLTMLSKTKVTLYDRANFFDTNNLNGFLAIQLLMHRTDKVHIPGRSLNTTIHNWKLVEATKEYQNNMETNIKQNKAIARYALFLEKSPNIGSLTNNPVYWVGVQLTDPRTGVSIIKSNPGISTATIDAKINDYLKLKGDDLEERIKTFNDVMDTYEGQRELFYLNYLVKQAFNTGRLVRRDGYVYWLSQHRDPAFYKFSTVESFKTRMFEEMQIASDKFIEFVNELRDARVAIPEPLDDFLQQVAKLQSADEKNNE
ncbi:MAG: hypothetical protein D6711_10715 [Chloroflexi bacterium]|nr:MAG: hypothetical protein D6711_10715 [Chloroflexota bacterium]